MSDDLETIIKIRINPAGGYEILYDGHGLLGTAWGSSSINTAAVVRSMLDRHERMNPKKSEG